MKKISVLALPVILLVGLYNSEVTTQTVSGGIKGQITNTDGGALPGASVIKKEPRGAITNLAVFELLGVPAIHA